MTHNQIDIITLGCSKNLVDSELLMKQLEANGFTCTHDSDNLQGEIAVVNTCGFISDAKEESINTILELAQAKDEGRLSRLYVMGCLSQRYRDELKEEIPQVDKFYGKFDYKRLLEDLGKSEMTTCAGQRHLTTPPHYAYLKIAEGCDRHCAYCAIPLITGTHVSRPIDEILEEVRWLVSKGVKEFQVIAQELTYYGIDFNGERHIAELISRIADVEGVEWIRLHYAYPAQFPDELLTVIKNTPNVCKYLDVALQHVSDNVLQRMRRNFSKEETYRFVENLRKAIPGITLRTTLMVGFPGETEADFEELVAFVKWAQFERMGAFAYSEEDGTYAALHYKDDVPDDVKRARLDHLMTVQQEISEELAAAEVGKTLRVIIDRKEGAYYVGRAEGSSPEVDPEVLISADRQELRIGSFYQVQIIDSDEFDLYGKAI